MLNLISRLSFIFVLCVLLEYFVIRDYNLHRYINRDKYENPFDKKGFPKYPISKKLVITGLARNIANRIEQNIRMCSLLGSYFSDYKIIIFENDSIDNTRQIIKDCMKSNRNIHLIDSLKYPECKLRFPLLYNYGIVDRQRISKMSFYRNICNHFTFKFYNEYDYMIVLDMDIEGGLPIFKILNSMNEFDHNESLGAICANGRSPIPGTLGHLDTMYDAMAFCENKTDLENSKYIHFKSFGTIIFKYLRMMSLSYAKRRFIPVCSAFNGLCIYKLNHILNCNYTDEYVCEHIGFQNQLFNSGKIIMIDLDLRIFVGHQGPKRLIDFF